MGIFLIGAFAFSRNRKRAKHGYSFSKEGIEWNLFGKREWSACGLNR